jgi:hypothetical protein
MSFSSPEVNQRLTGLSATLTLIQYRRVTLTEAMLVALDCANFVTRDQLAEVTAARFGDPEVVKGDE